MYKNPIKTKPTKHFPKKLVHDINGYTGLGPLEEGDYWYKILQTTDADIFQIDFYSSKFMLINRKQLEQNYDIKLDDYAESVTSALKMLQKA